MSKKDYEVFLSGILTPALKEKYHIKSIEKANVCYKGNHILVPLFEVYVRAVLDENQEAELENYINAAYKEYYRTDILPGVNILTSALYAREYKGKYYHLRIPNDSPDRNFPDYELFEVSKEGYESVLDMKRGTYESEYDEKLIVRITYLDETYKEIWKNALSDKLLEIIGV